MELITRRIIKDFEGDDSKNLEAYAKTGSPEYQRMVNEIARHGSDECEIRQSGRPYNVYRNT